MKTLLFFLSLSLSLNMFSQVSRKTTDVIEYTNIEYYKTHYELKNSTILDEIKPLINLVNFSELEHLRKQDEDVEVYVNSLNETLILYSINKARVNIDEFLIKNQK